MCICRGVELFFYNRFIELQCASCALRMSVMISNMHHVAFSHHHHHCTVDRHFRSHSEVISFASFLCSSNYMLQLYNTQFHPYNDENKTNTSVCSYGSFPFSFSSFQHSLLLPDIFVLLTILPSIDIIMKNLETTTISLKTPYNIEIINAEWSQLKIRSAF